MNSFRRDGESLMRRLLLRAAELGFSNKHTNTPEKLCLKMLQHLMETAQENAKDINKHKSMAISYALLCVVLEKSLKDVSMQSQIDLLARCMQDDEKPVTLDHLFQKNMREALNGHATVN